MIMPAMGVTGAAGRVDDGAPGGAGAAALQHGQELDDNFTGIADLNGRMSIAGFGSLLSIDSARYTFPDLQNFRTRKIDDFRRVFAHTAPVFFERGIAKLDTLEISSLSCEEASGHSIVVSVFDVPYSPETVQAVIDREHEFRFLAVQPLPLDAGSSATAQSTAQPAAQQDALAVICGRWDDVSYVARRCPPDEFQKRFKVHGVDRVWRDDVLPCRTYCRHCVLAARKLGPEAEASFLDGTFLADRRTTVKQHLAANPDIMSELPPPELAARYSG